MEKQSLKIAFATDNSEIISQHFGSALFYQVVTVENGKITNSERREKFSPHAPGMKHEHHQHNEGNSGHGQGNHSEDKHAKMLSNIKDCDIMIARGMGHGIYNHLERQGIKPILTEIRYIEDAVNAVIIGNIIDHKDKLH